MREILERLEQKLDEKFTAIDARFDKVDARFDKVDARFDKVDARLDAMDARFDAMDARFSEGDQRFAGIEAQLHRQGVLIEALNGDVKMALEGIAGNRQLMDERFAEVMDALDQRVRPLEMAYARLIQPELEASRRVESGRRKR